MAIARNRLAVSGRKATGWNSSVPGRRMTSTPIKPTTTADQRRGPTRSPSNGIDRAVMNSGAENAMATTSASGISAKALKNRIIEVRPSTARTRWPFQLRVRKAASRSLRTASISPMGMKAKKLRKNTICMTGYVTASHLIVASITEKARIAANMNSAPAATVRSSVSAAVRAVAGLSVMAP